MFFLLIKRVREPNLCEPSLHIIHGSHSAIVHNFHVNQLTMEYFKSLWFQFKSDFKFLIPI
jgi:hypothetical protein